LIIKYNASQKNGSEVPLMSFGSMTEHPVQNVVTESTNNSGSSQSRSRT